MRTSSTIAGVLLGAASMTSIAAAQDAAQPADEIVVRGARIPDTKRATSEISSVLDDVSFQRTGDSDIAAALSRVTGLSISQGKYIIVRGLNERYSNVTINGSPLPSPEPLQRVAPLDIVPTSILSGSLVQKTFSPEYTGEFGGGQIDLQTTSVPDESFLDLSASIGLDTVTTGRDGLQYDGGDLDWFGIDDGTRDVPALLGGTFDTGVFADQDAIDASVANPETLVLVDNSVPVDYGVSFAGGSAFDVSDDIRIGFTIAGGLSNEWQTREGIRNQGFISSALNPTAGQQLAFTSTTNVVDTNAIATIGVELGDNHELTFTNFILRSTLKEGRVTTGFDLDSQANLSRQNTDFFERQVWQTQAKGEHVFPSVMDLSVGWRFAYGEAYRDAPFNQEITYQVATDGDVQIDASRNLSPLSNTLSFSRIDDENIDAGVDLQLPFEAFGNAHVLKGGISYLEKDRDTLNRLFRYNIDATASPDLLGSRADLILSEPVLASSIVDLSLVGGTEFHDNTFSEQRVLAAYFGGEFEAGPYVRINAGVRYEDGRQSTSSFNTLQPNSFTSNVIDEDYFLPAVTVTWLPVGDLQVRGGFSQTITRPQFRETAAAFFVDEDTDLLLTGNPFLQNTEIDNYDLRAEYYFSRGQFITVGAFYKDLTNPIEDAFSLQAGGLPLQTYVNAPSAELYGFEFEFEKNFLADDLVDWAILSGKELIVRTNYTWSDSSVSDEGTVTTRDRNPVTGEFIPQTLPGSNFIVDGRRLQGQSEHLVNVQFGIENPDTNMRATLLVNWASERIRNVETFRSGGVITPAVIEQPPVNVDFVWSRDLDTFGGNWNLGFSIRNILGDDYQADQTFVDGVSTFDSYNLGRRFSANLRHSF